MIAHRIGFAYVQRLHTCDHSVIGGQGFSAASIPCCRPSTPHPPYWLITLMAIFPGALPLAFGRERAADDGIQSGPGGFIDLGAQARSDLGPSGIRK